MNDTWKSTTLHSAMTKREFVWLEAWKAACMNARLDLTNCSDTPEHMADICLTAFDRIFKQDEDWDEDSCIGCIEYGITCKQCIGGSKYNEEDEDAWDEDDCDDCTNSKTRLCELCENGSNYDDDCHDEDIDPLCNNCEHDVEGKSTSGTCLTCKTRSPESPYGSKYKLKGGEASTPGDEEFYDDGKCDQCADVKDRITENVKNELKEIKNEQKTKET